MLKTLLALIQNILRKKVIVLSLLFWTFSSFSQWTDFNPGISGDFRDIEIYGPQKYICGNSGIYMSEDYVSWSLFMTGTTADVTEIMENTVFYAVETYNHFGYKTYACGYDTIANQGVVFHTSGDTWELEFYLDDIRFYDLEKTMSGGDPQFYVVGDEGAIFTKDDLGGDWIDRSYPTGKSLHAVQGYDYDRVLIAGDSIVLFNDTDLYPLVWDSIHGHTIYDMETGFYYDQYGVGDDFSFRFFGLDEEWTYNSSFDPETTPQSIGIESSSLGYIGTGNGIYKSEGILAGPWEFQPSSEGNSIRAIKTNGEVAYAVGDGSVMIKTENAGGTPLPYVNFYNPLGVCVDSLAVYANYGNPGYEYEWYINDVYQSAEYDLEHTFDVTGTYTVKVVVDNGVYTDSMEVITFVYNLPETDKSYDVPDSILCKAGDADFILHETEPDVYYALYNMELGTTTSYTLGTGGDLVLNTGTISDSAHYLVKARRGVSECITFLDDTTLIAVEQTQADFHVSHINALQESPVYFFNQSEQASIFNWTVETPAPFTTTAENFDHLYSDLEQYPVTLIAESEWGCADTITKLGPFVYDTTTYQEACWALKFGPEAEATYGHNRILDIEVDEHDNIYICGSMHNMIFQSEHGIQPHTPHYGFYVAKLDKFGIMQWKMECDQTLSPGIDYIGGYGKYGEAFDVELGQHGDIYLSGWVAEEAQFYFNNGDSLIFDNISGDGYVMKLDSMGRYKWHSTSNRVIYDMVVGPEDNVVISGRQNYHIELTGTDGVTSILPSAWEDGENVFLASLDSNGVFEFAFRPFSGFEANYLELMVDGDNNINILGTHDYSPDDYYVFSSDMTPTLIEFPYTHGTFIIQFDEDGLYNWKSNIYSPGGGAEYSRDIDIDTDNNIYVQVATSNYFDDTSYLEDSESNSYETSAGELILASVSQDGLFRWMQGTERGNEANYNAISVRDGIVYSAAQIYGYEDSTYLTSTTPGDSLMIPVPANGDWHTFFSAWTLEGDPLWYSYENGPHIPAFQQVNGTYKSLEVDSRGNLIYSTISLSYNTVALAGDTLHIDNAAGVLAKYNPAMCFNTIDVNSMEIYCGGEIMSVGFNFEALDPVGEDNVYYLTVTDDLEDPTFTDTLASLESMDSEGVIEAIVPDTLYGKHHIKVISSDPYYFSYTDSVLFDQPPLPHYLDSAICPGDSISYFASEYDVAWSPDYNISETDYYHVYMYPDTSTTYVCELTNTCGVAYDTIAITVHLPHVFAGNDTVICITDSLLLDATGPAVMVEWSNGHPDGTFFYPEYSVELIVYGTTEFCYDEDTIFIDVEPLPDPVITIYDGDLATNEFDHYQWYLNGEIIPGATEQYYDYTENGYYHVEVWDLEGCTGASELYPISDLSTGVLDIRDLITVAPNPTKGEFNVFLPNKLSVDRMLLTDMAGKIIETPVTISKDRYNFDLSGLEAGVYLLYLQMADERITWRVVKY